MKAKLSNFVALDIGSSKVAGVAAYVDKKGECKILSQNLHSSEGIKSGLITDLKAAENSIIGTIYELEKECEKNIKQVAISLSGAGTKSYYVNHKIKLSNQPITKQDVKKLIQKALDEFKVKDREIIHYFPVEFIVDDNDSIIDPVGMIAREFACELHIVSVNTSIMVNLTNCLAKYQVEITSVVLGIYASSLATLNDDEKDLGSILIDIGACTTAFGVFKGGKLVYTGHVLTGGAQITSDIAKLFSISLTTAEKLKVIYGNAIASKFDKDYHINLDELESANNSDIYNSNIVITSNQLNQIIQNRLGEIFTQVKEQYDKIGIDHLIARRVVLTGGGASLKNSKELAHKIFDKQVRIAKPGLIPGFAEGHNPPMYSSLVGMVNYYSNKLQKSSFENLTVNVNNSWIKKAISWIKENI
jgi:cell division protein FtsA